MAHPTLNDDDFAAFWRDGYRAEARLLRRRGDGAAAARDRAGRQHPRARRADRRQRRRRHRAGAVEPPGRRSLRRLRALRAQVAGGAERLLGGEVYHYHSKLTMKRPRAGGAWEWHQDYGYWYNNGCLFPTCLSVAIAVDRATRENGCLQVIRGSHQLGRLDHGRVGDQTGADMERVEEVLKSHERVYCEMAPGDALFFHCNTLHASAPNLLGAAAQRPALLLQQGDERPLQGAPPPALHAARQAAGRRDQGNRPDAGGRRRAPSSIRRRTRPPWRSPCAVDAGCDSRRACRPPARCLECGRCRLINQT